MRNAIQNFLLVVVVTIVVLFTVELVFRLFVPNAVIQDDSAKRPLESLIRFDPILQTRYESNVTVPVKSQYGEFAITYKTNELGLRDQPLKQETLGRRILVLGNSFVEGWGVEEEQGIVRVAEIYLNKTAAKPLQIINGGMSGFGVAQSYILGRELISMVAPSALVFVYISTMVQADQSFLRLAEFDSNGYATGLNPDALLGPTSSKNTTEPPSNNLFGSLARHSALASFIVQRLASKAAQNAIKAGDPDSDLLAGLRAEKNRLAALHEPSLKHVKAIAELAKSAGIPFLVIHLPMPHQLSESEWAQGRTAYGLERKIYTSDDVFIVARFCAANKINCVAAHSYLTEIVKNANNAKRFYYSYDFHPNSAGYEVTGYWMADEFKKHFPNIAK